MKRRETERHHYVPEFYLKHWCLDGSKLWVFFVDKEDPAFKACPRSFAAQKGLYAAHSNFSRELDHEAWLGNIESIFAKRWPDVFQDVAVPETKMNLSRFLALQYLRHPKRIEESYRRNQGMIELLDKLPPHIEEVEIPKEDGTHFVASRKEFRAHLIDQKNAKQEFHIGIRTSVEELAEILCGINWLIIESPEPYFVTSDDPIAVSNPTATSAGKPFGFATKGTEVSFPISPTALLLISDQVAHDAAHLAKEQFEEYASRSMPPLNAGAMASARHAIFSATNSIPGDFDAVMRMDI